MRVIFFNDTGHDMDMRVASAKEVAGLKRVLTGHAVEFDVGDVDEVFVKVWPGQVMVRSAESISALLGAEPTPMKEEEPDASP